MEWTDIRLTVSKADAEAAEAVATMIAEGGIYIEDYSDIEEQVEQIAHVDLIEQELLDKPRDTVIIHMYLEPGASPVETLASSRPGWRPQASPTPLRPRGWSRRTGRTAGASITTRWMWASASPSCRPGRTTTPTASSSSSTGPCFRHRRP